jgi:hypothetical protein
MRLNDPRDQDWYVSLRMKAALREIAKNGACPASGFTLALLADLYRTQTAKSAS